MRGGGYWKSSLARHPQPLSTRWILDPDQRVEKFGKRWKRKGRPRVSSMTFRVSSMDGKQTYSRSNPG